ncbi:hypothetical protein GCM10009122_02940 [Fulvivirga kasyanovii]|uniref:DUF4132 domain-containing protein n=1 Tax=Fulvivirga kasyanovii TaxID=396812 RepID=A0ABW9RRZ8_9BACT|nr:DUF4132 domain-containing protein [Fulvivirga kasyanovii]MTI26502.1 DUF4132 domain-containing protein [Fulvivirga kasyanovii]
MFDKFIKKFISSPKNNESKPANDANQADPVLTFLNSNYEITSDWFELFTHFILLDQHNKMPTKEWYTEAESLIEKVGKDEFMKIGIQWIKDCIEKSKEDQRRFKHLGPMAANDPMQENLGVTYGNTPDWVRKVYGEDAFEGGFFKLQQYFALNHFQNYFYQSLGGRIMRGFIQSAVILKDPQLLELVDLLALTNPNSSQDPIHIYSQFEPEISVSKLTNLKAKAKNKNILKRIDKAIAEVGKKSGLSKAEIEESVIPDYGINDQGEYIFQFGAIKGVFVIKNLKDNETFYVLQNGKKQKTAPAELKDNYPDQLKEFKKKIKEIKTSLSSQRVRIEEFFLTSHSIPYKTFVKNYITHNLIRILSKDLIWNFKSDDKNVNLLFHNGQFVDSNGDPFLENLDECSVTLWHPIGFESDYILSWRSFLIKNEILQAFKQAFREIYIITDAELNTESYSNRFASHILNKDHVAALCKVRGWSPSGIINNGKVTYRIPGTDYKAEYWVSDLYLGEHSKTYGSAHISTDQVRFYKKKDQLPLSEVPALIFSEVMRDIDLFVGVTSIGNDPEWHDRGGEGAQGYWSNYTNGELTERSKIRAEILKNLIPKMKIANKCSFDGKYLKVKGEVRNYKIHMGSGNILMEPNDQYLCIVPDRSSSKLKKVFIPFEGDNMLSIVISKALLLAEDDKIKDPTITRQISMK